MSTIEFMRQRLGLFTFDKCFIFLIFLNNFLHFHEKRLRGAFWGIITVLEVKKAGNLKLSTKKVIEHLFVNVYANWKISEIRMCPNLFGQLM